MDANAVALLAIFEKKLRLEVPLFQRQYVWNEEQQWAPLWEDISRKMGEYLEGRKDAPVHFLGAMVLDQKQTPTSHVEKRQVIDGQQRLTTLQIFLAAFRDFCRDNDCEELANECETFTLNKGMMAEPEVEKFKVWPTQLDRTQFTDVIESNSRAELEKRHPLTRRKYARKPDPRPRMVEAYLFFYNQLTEFFIGDQSDPPLRCDYPLATRLEEAFQALKNALKVAVIDLEKDDDAQVIFETLNSRGEPLLPADLLRNYIFLRAARLGESQEELYNEYWRHFDDPFWRHEVKQGRLKRPRSDLFMQHFLSSRQTVDIPIKHLFVEYKYWIEKKQPFNSVRDELATLARQGKDFHRIIAPDKEDTLYPLSTFLERYDIRTAYPLLLFLLDNHLSDGAWKTISTILESYLVRRAVCGLTTKNYNKIFLSVTRALQKEGASPENLKQHLAGLVGESTEWPTDETFGNAWLNNHVYHLLNNPKVVHILRRINDTYLDSRTENIEIEGQLTVEHILPQAWPDNWPLPGGERGLSYSEIIDADPDDPRVEATQARRAVLQTFGNLTILTQALNSSVSNSAWSVKKPEMLKVSLLPINQQLHEYEIWDEDAIGRRGRELLGRALKIWPGAD
ncbi:MAG TPA: DUF262 domain-containing protein [Gammaproteobacteria bacterium]|nr:DUF262 domain-containing protein [Gammaproteobacteria bacterium]